MIFGTSGIRGEFGTDVTAETALDAGRAVASEGASRVVVGRDVRTTGKLLADAVSSGLLECGADVISLGVVPTPTVARAVGWYDADAGIAVTASHNPPADNGLKFWTEEGQAVVGERQDALAARIERGEYDIRPWDEVGSVSTVGNATARHVDAIADGGDNLDLDVVLDVGNGTGELTADALRRTGCDVRTLDADPDGAFPVRPSEPTAENCSRLSAIVAESDADMGVAHDGDADRMMAVTESGEFVTGDVLLAAFALEAAEPGDEVAVPIDTSIAVTKTLETIGATTTYTRVGDGHVADRTTDEAVVFGASRAVRGSGRLSHGARTARSPPSGLRHWSPGTDRSTKSSTTSPPSRSVAGASKRKPESRLSSASAAASAIDTGTRQPSTASASTPTTGGSSCVQAGPSRSSE